MRKYVRAWIIMESILLKTDFCYLSIVMLLFVLRCLDVNECDFDVRSCDALAKCVNNVGSFTCTCIDGYTGNGFTCNGKYNNNI